VVALAQNVVLPAPRGNWLRLLGGFALELGGSTVSVPANCQRLLAYLGLNGAVPRADVAGTLWPEVSERNAHGSLRTTIWRISRCGPGIVDAAGGRLALAPTVNVDTRIFAQQAHTLIGGDEPDVTPLSTELELLPGWYEDWVIFERERLRQLRLHTLEAYATRLAARGSYAAALDLALETIRLEPLRESAHRVVIGIHIAEGNVVEAMRHYRFVTGLLADELGVKPSPQLIALLPPGLVTPLATQR
jgi:DNA-binding SARP family transcriptional activator